MAAARRPQTTTQGRSARGTGNRAPTAAAPAVPAFQNPDWMTDMKEKEATPGTIQNDLYHANAGARSGSPQNESDALKMNTSLQSAFLGDELAGMGQNAVNRGTDALDRFYGIEKPADTVVADTQSFADANAVDPSLGRNAEIDRAFGISEGLIDQIMNTPSQTKIIGDQVLSQQLALGRSSPGGIGNVQAGVKAAMGAAPGLQRDAQQASINEQVTRAQAATGAAQIYAGVAQGTADRDVRIAESNQVAATNVLSTMTTKYGQDLNFTTEQRGQIGQMARDFFANQVSFAQMDVTQQIAAWDNITRVYGIDATLKAAMEQIAASENIGPLDAFKLVLGAADAGASFATAGA